MKNTKIAHLRLENQGIACPTFEQPGDVVAWMGAMQAQDYAGGKWSIGLRLPDATDALVEQAIAEHRIVRTWPLRGTLHFVAAADVRWILALTAARTIAGSARRYRELELDTATLVRSNDLLLKALQGGNRLSRRALLSMLEENGISTQGQRAAYMLSRASLDGLICQSVTVRNDPIYVALEEALPPTRPLEREEALATLAQRFFSSHGPATLQDFARWAALTITDGRAGLDAVQRQFVSEAIDGETYWMSPASGAGVPPDSLYLLPGFDEYILGYKDRGAVLDPAYFERIVPGGNGMFYSTIVIDGQVVGTWRRTIKKKTVTVTAEPFEGLKADERAAFTSAAHRYAGYLELALKAD